jgi:hypothetical protein
LLFKSSEKEVPDRATSVFTVIVVGDMERPQTLLFEPEG